MSKRPIIKENVLQKKIGPVECTRRKRGPIFRTDKKKNKWKPRRKTVTLMVQKWKGAKPSLRRRPITKTQPVLSKQRVPAKKSKPPITELIKNSTRADEGKCGLK
jgi:hypothetical protein